MCRFDKTAILFGDFRVIRYGCRALLVITMVHTKSPNPVDKHVGSRVRMRRLMLDMSQTELANALGITFQQVQKYENGTNRVSASGLMQISRFLKPPVPFFFEGAPSAPNGRRGAAEEAQPTYVSDFLATSDGLALVKAFINVKNAKLRRCIVHLVEEIAAG
jgi:transcriptional regulator with XRE-family HTH domain